MNKQRRTLKREARRGGGERYALGDSGFVGMKSLSKLEALLQLAPGGLQRLADDPKYREWVDESKPAKPRAIQDPKGGTERLHYRLYKLLNRLKRPDFLHSSRRKRSNLTNAEAHRADQATACTDIHAFYEATTTQHVAQFFRNDLGMAADLAAMLAKACCVHGHLPTGSPISQLLAYFAHRRTFELINSICVQQGVVMTLYVDDLTLTGPGAVKALLRRAKSLLLARGLHTHKDRSIGPYKAKQITGVVIHADGTTQAPDKLVKRTVDQIDAVPSVGFADRDKTTRSVLGRLSSISTIDAHLAAQLSYRFARVQDMVSNEQAKRDQGPADGVGA